MKLIDYYFNGETVSIVLFLIGIYGIIGRKNIVKTIISIGIMETAAILFFVTINYVDGNTAPIGAQAIVKGVDPLPQALMITAIVIGITITAISLIMFINLYHKYGSTNWEKVIKKRMEE